MLTDAIVDVADLTASDMELMYELMSEYYDNVLRDTFLKDLRAKKGVLLVFDEYKKICGFTTYDVFKIDFEEEIIHVLYSGDTVIRKKYWGHVNTSRIFISLLMKCKNEYNGPLFWFLITKGIRTYRLLPLFFKSYYPSYLFSTPEYEKNIIRYLARIRFEDHYIENEGIIRFDGDGDYLKRDFDHIDEHKKLNPHVKHFLRLNPGYRRGDNLPCIARVDWDNFTHMAHKFLGSRMIGVQS